MAKAKKFQMLRLRDGSAYRILAPKFARLEPDGSASVFATEACEGDPVRVFQGVASLTEPVEQAIIEEI